MRVWITGARGLIGGALIHTAPHFAPGWETISLTRQLFDLADYPAVRKAFHRDRPDLVIHGAAISRIADCQSRRDLAWTVNFGVTGCLADLAAGIPFIFLSSEQVFDGRAGPYDETSATNPLNVYGETKLAAEQVVLANPRHTVVRLVLTYGHSAEANRSFNEEMVRRWERGEKIKLFTDEFRCPIAATAVARAIWELARRECPGLYHLAGSERLSRLQIGELLLARRPQYRSLIEPVSLKDYSGPPRAGDLTLNCNKLQQLLSFPLPKFSEWLADEDQRL